MDCGGNDTALALELRPVAMGLATRPARKKTNAETGVSSSPRWLPRAAWTRRALQPTVCVGVCLLYARRRRRLSNTVSAPTASRPIVAGSGSGRGTTTNVATNDTKSPGLSRTLVSIPMVLMAFVELE